MYILGIRFDTTTYLDATKRILNWARDNEFRDVCVDNVHVVMETGYSNRIREIVNSASLVTPDGRPLVWPLRMLG